MDTRKIGARILSIVGIVVMPAGLLDPLEGVFVIFPSGRLVALGAFLGKSRKRKFAYWACGLTAIGMAG
jgi:hypothetical protein